MSEGINPETKNKNNMNATYAITATYTAANAVRLTRDIMVEATSRAEAISKVAEMIQTKEYQHIPENTVLSLALTS